MRCLAISWIAVAVAISVSPANADEPSRTTLPATFEKLLPLHTKLGPPQPHDWLAEHKEPGQTYAQYLRGQPVRVDKQRRVIYVQPLGEFDSAQRKVLNRTAEFGDLLPVAGEGPRRLVVGRDSRRSPPRASDLARQANPVDVCARQSPAATTACRRLCVYRVHDIRPLAG